MARLIHPSYFPATRAIGEAGCSYYLNLPLVQGMEAYWRVKKWRLVLNLNWAETLNIFINQIIDVSTPSLDTPINSEDQLVCGYSQRWNIPVSGSGAFGSGFSKSSGGFIWSADGFEFLDFQWPAVAGVDVLIPIEFSMGGFSQIINGSVSQQADTTGSGSVSAIEWWPYEDADGKALYDITTGQPL